MIIQKIIKINKLLKLLYNLFKINYMSRFLLIFVAILLLGIISRFFWIDKVPHSINGDQLHYILSSKSFVLSGKDLTQSVSLPEILLFRYPPKEAVQAELTYFLDILTVGWM